MLSSPEAVASASPHSVGPATHRSASPVHFVAGDEESTSARSGVIVERTDGDDTGTGDDRAELANDLMTALGAPTGAKRRSLLEVKDHGRTLFGGPISSHLPPITVRVRFATGLLSKFSVPGSTLVEDFKAVIEKVETDISFAEMPCNTQLPVTVYDGV